MADFSGLNETVKALEQDQNALRIKKFIFYVCKNLWQNDESILNTLDVKTLIQELQLNYPTLESLNNTFQQFAKSLNKPDEYLLIANLIISKVQTLYNHQVEVTEINSTLNPSSIFTRPLSNQQPNVKDLPKIEQKLKFEDMFNLRLEIIRFSNPLRVKIILFSLLYDPINFRDKSWLETLNTQNLSDLLQKICVKYKTFYDFECDLRKITHTLEDREENLQAVSGLIQAIKPFYAANTT